MKNTRKRFRTLVVLGSVALLLIIGWFALPAIVEHSLRKVLQRVEPSGYHISFKRLHTGFREGNLRITGLVVRPSDALWANDSLMQFKVEAHEVKLNGVDLQALLFDRILFVRSLTLNEPTVQHSYSSKALASAKDSSSDKESASISAPSIIRLDSLFVYKGSGSSLDRSGSRKALSVDRLDLIMTGIFFAQSDNGTIHIAQERTFLALEGIRSDVEPFYTLTIGKAQLQLPEDSLLVTDIQLITDVKPGEYHKHVKEQVELYSLRVDTAVLHGFDLMANLQRGALRARKAEVANWEVNIHRDKSIPEGPFKRKPLPSELLMDLSIPVDMDSIVARNGSVRYNERTERGMSYGSLPFTSINVLVTGLNNRPSSEAVVLHVEGTAKIAERGYASLVMDLPMVTENPTVEIHARLRELPFEVLNRMTDQLVKVNATKGRIHLVDMHMKGNDRRATGTMELQYEDLSLALNQSVGSAKMLSVLANLVVKRNNMPEQGSYKTSSFQVDRQRNKGIFNYLWTGMREGMLDVMVPKVVLDKVRKEKK